VTRSFIVGEADAGERVDLALSAITGISRSQARRWIDDGLVRVNRQACRPSQRVQLGDALDADPPEPLPSPLAPEPIPLHILWEDAELIVLDKPAGLVVHPAPGHASGTLVNALLHHCADLAGVGGVLRPGIVHRLDQGTSGVLVVAKHDRAHRALAAQWKEHAIEREYLAFVKSAPRADAGTVDAPIGRHPTDRKKMSTHARVSRSAVTHWRVEERLRDAALLRVRLETGRTHQIRVHMASIGLALIGDPVYGGGRAHPASRGLRRQALHATVLGFTHPTSGARLRFESPLPADLVALLESLR
jgi:23S rRNA pseudouridine1911/1915/1917 synthase